MSMKKIVMFSLWLAFFPLWMMAQGVNDDLYFIPKKKQKEAKVVVEKENTPTTVYASPGSTVVVKDVKGNVRDVDEYNRRYTSRENSFYMNNDTLYIEEKPYDERGEWINGFEGTQSDYEYAMRIIRFRNPRYAIPVSSPLYWDVVYTLPSWEWNVFDDGFYAYAFPTFSNSLWWDWRYSWNWSWGPSWHYNYYTPYWGWGVGAHWHHSHLHHPHWHHAYHHHFHPGWAGTGGYLGKNHGWNGSVATRPGIHAGRYKNNYQKGYVATGNSARRSSISGNRNSRDRYVSGVRQNSNRTNRVSSGRVVTGKEGTASSSVRPQRSVTRTRTDVNAVKQNTRSENTYTRPVEGKGSSYTRQSSTRRTVNNTNDNSSYRRKSEAAERGAYRSNSTERSNVVNRSSYENNRSSSSSRNSFSSGSSSSRSSSASGGASRSSSGGRSRR